MYVGLCMLERAPILGNKVFDVLYCIVHNEKTQFVYIYSKRFRSHNKRKSNPEVRDYKTANLSDKVFLNKCMFQVSFQSTFSGNAGFFF